MIDFVFRIILISFFNQTQTFKKTSNQINQTQNLQYPVMHISAKLVRKPYNTSAFLIKTVKIVILLITF